MKGPMSRGLVVVMSMGLTLLIGATRVAGQAATNTARIEGRITDTTGGTLPGVAVTISSPALQAPQFETVTDDNGRYRFANLPGGTYTVMFALSGFQKLTRSDLKVDAGFVATFDAQLSVGAVEETITVTGASPLVDVRTTSVSANIKKELMDTIPTSRSYADVGKLAAGVRLSGVPDVGGSQTGGQRGNLISYGSNAGGQTLMLDGVNTDGTSGYWDFGAIDEMVVRPSGNDPEIPTSGMAFQVILKSGGNSFHGDGQLAWQGQRLQGDNIDDRLTSLGVTGGNPMDHYYDADLAAGGRIVRDRLWYFGSGRRKEYGQQVIGYSGAPGNDGLYFTADDVAGTTTDRESNIVGKFTAQLTQKQRFAWTDHYGVKKQDDRSASAFVPHEAAVNYSLPSHVYNGEWTYTVSPRSVLLASVGRSWYQSSGLPYSDKPSTFDQVSMRWGGAAVNSVGTGSDAAPAGSWSQRWQYNTTYTYFLPEFLRGDHELKVGGYFTREWYNRHQDLRGPGTGGTGQDYRLYFTSTADKTKVPTAYINPTPVEVLLFNSPFESHNNVNYQSAFIRDAARLTNRLTVNAGVRFERYDVFFPPQSKPTGPFSAAASYSEVDLYKWGGIAPRFGVSYALTRDNKNVIKATYGRFNFAIRPSDSTIVRNLNGNEYEATRYRWNDVNNDHLFQYATELGTFVQTEGGATSRGLYNGDLKEPKTDEATTFFERQIGSSVAARVGYVFKRESAKYRLVNTNRPYGTYNIPITTVDPGPDGSPGTADDGGPVTYYDYDPSVAGTAFDKSLALNVPGYTDRYDNIEVAVDKRMSNRWQLLTSFLGTKKNVWSAAANSGPPTNPNEAFFPKDQTWDRTFRAAGSFQMPWGISSAAIYEYQSGTAQARDVLFRTGLKQQSSLTLRMEPLGAHRLPANKLLSLRAAKRLSLPHSHHATLQFDLYNALNANDATTQSVRSGPTFGQITAILPPRVARLGFTYTF